MNILQEPVPIQQQHGQAMSKDLAAESHPIKKKSLIRMHKEKVFMGSCTDIRLIFWEYLLSAVPTEKWVHHFLNLLTNVVYAEKKLHNWCRLKWYKFCWFTYSTVNHFCGGQKSWLLIKHICVILIKVSKGQMCNIWFSKNLTKKSQK